MRYFNFIMSFLLPTKLYKSDKYGLTVDVQLTDSFVKAMEIRQNVLKLVSHCLQTAFVDVFVVANLHQDLVLFAE